MKVTAPTNVPHGSTPDANKAAPKRNSAQVAGEPSAESGALGGVESGGGGRDFASVLREVTRAAREEGDKDGGTGEEHDANAHDGVEREHEAQRRGGGDDEGSSAGGGLGQREGVREATFRSEVTNPRAILHVADLERIVAAVRTQIVADGRREVTLELQRSVLEGLRVKLSADEAGRVTAEFIASSERVRAHLEARASDLADLMRSRGVDLAALRTTVGTDSSNQSGDGPPHRSADNFVASSDGGGGGGRGGAPSGEARTSAVAGNEASPVEDGSTYRG